MLPPTTRAFAQARLTANVVQSSTHLCCDNPWLVECPDVGLEVTAAGVFAELLRIAESLAVHASTSRCRNHTCRQLAP